MMMTRGIYSRFLIPYPLSLLFSQCSRQSRCLKFNQACFIIAIIKFGFSGCNQTMIYLQLISKRTRAMDGFIVCFRACFSLRSRWQINGTCSTSSRYSNTVVCHSTENYIRSMLQVERKK